jgi:hypothetical protein
MRDNLYTTKSATIFLVLLLPVVFVWRGNSGVATKLTLRETVPLPQKDSELQMPDQIPHSRVARGSRNITFAWLAGPTDRYRHGVLGDEVEASRLAVVTRLQKRLQVNLPPNRVFEDLEPRLADLDGDGDDEIIVVESDDAFGASLAVYDIIGGRLVRTAATPFLGWPYRWLNPLGVGDFDGDGNIDIALVATPHIGGRLRLYRFRLSTLSLFAEYTGVSTHRIGSTELGLGHVVSETPRDRLLVPDQAHRVISLLEWSPDDWRVVARALLPQPLASSLTPVAKERWHFRLENNQHYELHIARPE